MIFVFVFFFRNTKRRFMKRKIKKRKVYGEKENQKEILIERNKRTRNGKKSNMGKKIKRKIIKRK